jgi:16S rRNA (guanine527-N7)-methyltransferase
MNDSPLTPGPKAIGTILKRCGVELDEAQLGLLWRYHQMLRQANAQLNLTRIHRFESIVLKHYVDSLLVLKYIDLPAPLIDMGSGAGLPGIPLAIARPGLLLILAEPRGHRAAFLRDVCARLGLGNVEIYAHKVASDYPAHVAGVITRAVGPIPETLDRVITCLPPGGRMIFMKGPRCDSEILAAAQSHAHSFRMALDRAYTIPGTPHHRRLVVYERLQGAPPETPASRSDRSIGSDGSIRAHHAAHGMLAADAFPGKVREITSASNPTFHRCCDLLSGPGIRKFGEAILAGRRICGEVLARYSEHVLGWLTGSDGPPPPDQSIEWLRLSDPLLKQLDVVGTHSPLLLVRVPPIPRWSDDDPWPRGCTLFVPFQDPENVGAVIRSAAAFGAARVVLLREAAHPFHPRASRAAGPALFLVPLLQGPPLEELRVHHAPLIALDTSGPELGETPFPPSFGLVVGIEGPGLPIGLHLQERRRIPLQPAVESLNAATAAAIALYVWARELPSVGDHADKPPPDPVRPDLT